MNAVTEYEANQCGLSYQNKDREIVIEVDEPLAELELVLESIIPWEGFRCGTFNVQSPAVPRPRPRPRFIIPDPNALRESYYRD